MDEISGMLQKIRTLAVQASNGTNTADDKAALSKEASALANEITRIANQTTFAGKKILAGQQENTDTIFSKAATADKSKAGTITLQVEFCERALRDWPVVLSRRPAYLRNLVCS